MRARGSGAGSRAVKSVARERIGCRIAHGRARRTPVICHAPAQQRLSPTPPPAGYEHVFFYAAVAFHHGPFGGAAKARRWAALTSWHMPNRRTPHLSVTHGAGHIRTYPDISGQPDIVGQKRVVVCGIVCRRITCGHARRVRKEPVPDRVP